jgi:hypothetical protein
MIHGINALPRCRRYVIAISQTTAMMNETNQSAHLPKFLPRRCNDVESGEQDRHSLRFIYLASTIS